MSRKLTIEFIKSEFEKENYILLTTSYKNNKQKLEYTCSNGHIWCISYDAWKRGKRCAKCSNNAKLNIDYIRNVFSEESYILLTNNYINAHQRLHYICPNKHKHFISWSNWNNKKKFRCPKCSNRISKQEKIISNFLYDLGIDVTTNDRSVLVNPITGRNLELDMWLPDINKAIEFNGGYWHRDPARRKCDEIKKKLCEKLCIDLLVITYEEWVEDVEKCRDKIVKFVEV